VNVQLLIDSIVRQVTVLIAQLATSGGLRAPVAHIANQVFVELANELDAQGVSRKVSADMFGMALRTYIRKLRRLSESSTERGRSLWEAVLNLLDQGEVLSRDEVIKRFHRDDEMVVRGILHDLTESGLVFCAGSGQSATYRAATEQELGRMRQFASQEGTDELVWVLVYREGPLSFDEIEKRCARDRQQLQQIIQRLVDSGRVQRPLNSPLGWEAAVFDHLQACVQTICSRLRENSRFASAEDMVGGSTYSFDIWPGHPMESEVLQCLKRFRRVQSALRQRVDDYNAKHRIPDEYTQVVMYGGQCLLARNTDSKTEGFDE
jgi:predicted transcriptional regulator